MFHRVAIYIRRTLYLLSLAAAFLFYLFHASYFAWLVFAVAIAIPAVGVAVSLPLLLGSRVLLEHGDGGASPEGFQVKVRVKAGYTPNPIRLTVRFTNQFTGETMQERLTLLPDKTLEIPCRLRGCGVVRCAVARPRMADLLGLFWLPMRKPAVLEVLVPPQETVFTGALATAPDADETGLEQYDKTAKGRTRTPMDIREYRSGDSIRDVHWKLTARHGKYIVKEYASPPDDRVAVAALWAGTPDELDRMLGRLAGLVRHLGERGIPFRVRLLSGSGEVLAQAAHDGPGYAPRLLDDALWRLLASPPPPHPEDGDPLHELALAQPGLMLATPDGILTDAESLRREAGR